MSDTGNRSSLPEFRDWSVPAVHLLRGVVYSDETKVWSILLRSQTALEGYFARIGLQVMVDETEGYAYLRQWSDEECPETYQQLPKLVRRVPLGYRATLLAVLLRDELRRYDEEDVHNERCVIEAETLFQQWKAFFPLHADEVRQRGDFKSAVTKLVELAYIRKFQDAPEAYEIRRIIKARLAASDLEALKTQLLAIASERTENTDGEASNG